MKTQTLLSPLKDTRVRPVIERPNRITSPPKGRES
jgi:hypothetical protein